MKLLILCLVVTMITPIVAITSCTHPEYVEPIATITETAAPPTKQLISVGIDKRELISVVFQDATGNEYGYDNLTKTEFQAMFGFTLEFGK